MTAATLPRRPSPSASTAKPAFSLGQISEAGGRRIVLFGPGGIGKTSLVASAPGPVAFFDLDDSLPRLRQQLQSCPHPLDIRPVSGVRTWRDIREALASDIWSDIKTIAIDSFTRAEELAVEHTLKTVTKERGENAKNVEDYGYGKGYTHVYDTFLPILSDLDKHAAAGRTVVLICHDCTTTVPNPAGEDWLRYEPRLQSPSSGKSSIRLRVREWADDVLFLGWDINVSKNGLGTGCDHRTLYPREQAFCMAKSRSLSDTILISQWDRTLWTTLIGQ